MRQLEEPVLEEREALLATGEPPDPEDPYAGTRALGPVVFRNAAPYLRITGAPRVFAFSAEFPKRALGHPHARSAPRRHAA